MTMPPKSKASKPEETVVEPEVSQTEEKDSDTASVPSWRAEVVEEGVEKKSEEKEKEETIQTPVTETSEKPKDEEEKVADLTNEETSAAGETPETLETAETPASSWTEETSSSTTPSDNTVTISLSKKFFWLFLFLLIGGLVVGGFFYYKSKVGGESAGGVTETSQPTSAPEATVTPTPSEEFKLDELKVNILNGSGIPGEAGKVQALLEEAGFADFKAGNADNYSYTITEVSLKEGVSGAAFDAVKEALDEYNVVKQEDTLAEDSEFDVEIIVGTKKAATSPTPTQ